MKELGEYLKKSRKEKGISLEVLEEKTKIRKRYLQAIENGRFDLIPGQIYLKGFLKSYADAIGLNSTEILQTYKNELDMEEDVDVEEEHMDTTKVSTVKFLLFFVFALFGVAFLWYLIANLI